MNTGLDQYMDIFKDAGKSEKIYYKMVKDIANSYC